MAEATVARGGLDRRRWLLLWVIGLAQLMVVLDGFLAAGVVLLAAFAAWQTRAAHPLLPPRVVLDRNRSGAYPMLFVSAGLFGTFLFLTYYLQQTLGYSPLVTGVAFPPPSGAIIVAAHPSTILLMPRTGPRPPVASRPLAPARVPT